MNTESEETEEIKTFPLYPYLLQGYHALPNCKPISDGHPSNVRYDTFALIDHPRLSHLDLHYLHRYWSKGLKGLTLAGLRLDELFDSTTIIILTTGTDRSKQPV